MLGDVLEVGAALDVVDELVVGVVLVVDVELGACDVTTEGAVVVDVDELVGLEFALPLSGPLTQLTVVTQPLLMVVDVADGEDVTETPAVDDGCAAKVGIVQATMATRKAAAAPTNLPRTDIVIPSQHGQPPD